MEDSSGDQRLTLSQIAEAAGVSVPTVSKVINQRSDVSPATRARIEQIISEHGYISNRAARNLRKGSSGQIDFVVQEFNSYYAFEILRGVEETLLTTDFRVALASTVDLQRREHRWREDQWLKRIADGSTDGAILVLVDSNSMQLRELQRLKIPFVVVDRMGELGPDIPSVGATNWAGGKTATQYLLSLGHRRIAALLGSPSFPCTNDRLAGYRAALEEARISVDPNLILFGDFSLQSAQKKMHELLALPEPPTAVFVGNDEEALGVYRALYERGLSIPRDMSVVGFDDMFYSELVTPPLTTIRQPLTEMGRVATNMLLRLLSNKPLDSSRVELATPLLKRASCAPPGSR